MLYSHLIMIEYYLPSPENLLIWEKNTRELFALHQPWLLKYGDHKEKPYID